MNKEYYINELKKLTNYFEDTLRLKLTNETLQDIIYDFTHNNIKVDRFLDFYRKNYFQDKYSSIKYTPIGKLRAIVKDYLKAKEEFTINYYDNDFKELESKIRSLDVYVMQLEKKKDGSSQKFYDKDSLGTLKNKDKKDFFSINELSFLKNYRISFILENYETQNFKNLFMNFKQNKANDLLKLKNDLLKIKKD
jgi:hypothetical protein